MNKCYRCAELEGCWAGLHGKGKKNCECYFSKDEKHSRTRVGAVSRR